MMFLTLDSNDVTCFSILFSVLLFQFLVLEPSISERSDANLQKIRIFQKSLEKQVLFLNYWHHRKSCYTCIFMVSLLNKSSLVYLIVHISCRFMFSKVKEAIVPWFSGKPSSYFIFNSFVCHFCQFHIFIFFVLYFSVDPCIFATFLSVSTVHIKEAR